MTQLIKVWTDAGGSKPVAMLARVIDEHDGLYTVQYFSATEDRDHGRIIYRYEDETYEIDDDSITEYLDSVDESDVGYNKIAEDACVKDSSDSDEDYVPSEEDEEEEDEEDEPDEEEEDQEDYYAEED
jgi:hypothetical protein